MKSHKKWFCYPRKHKIHDENRKAPQRREQSVVLTKKLCIGTKRTRKISSFVLKCLHVTTVPSGCSMNTMYGITKTEKSPRTCRTPRISHIKVTQEDEVKEWKSPTTNVATVAVADYLYSSHLVVVHYCCCSVLCPLARTIQIVSYVVWTHHTIIISTRMMIFFSPHRNDDCDNFPNSNGRWLLHSIFRNMRGKKM